MKNKGYVMATNPWMALKKIYKKHGQGILIKTWPCFCFIWKYEIDACSSRSKPRMESLEVIK